MKQMVESKTQGTVEFQTEVNPNIIGGLSSSMIHIEWMPVLRPNLITSLHSLRNNEFYFN